MMAVIAYNDMEDVEWIDEEFLDVSGKIRVICLLPGVNVDESDQDVRIPVVTTAEHMAGIWTDEHRPTD